MLKNLLLLVVTLLVTALGAEVAVRAAGFEPRQPRISPHFAPDRSTTWSQPDPELGWINKAGIADPIGGGERMTYWDFGRRAIRPSSEPPPGDRIPVMIVGGSDAQSYGVRDEDGFIYKLSERYPHLWFENWGTGGYSTVQSLMMAERVYEKFYTDRKPKLLLLTFSSAHMERNVSNQTWMQNISDSEGRYVSPPHYLLRGKDMEFQPFHVIDFWPLEKQSAALTLLHNAWIKSRYSNMDQAFEVTQRLIARFADFAAKHDMRFAVMVLEDYTEEAPRVFIGQPFPHKDCSGFERTDPQNYLLAENNHPNPKLHAHFVACLSGWLDSDVLPQITGAIRAP